MSEATKPEDIIKELVSKATADDKGNLTLPDEVLADVDPIVALAAKNELKYRNTQKGYTQTRQELKKISTVNQKLIADLERQAKLTLTAEQRDELNALKIKDPEQWREKLQAYEDAAKQSLKDKLKSYEQEGQQLSELELRKQMVQAFAESTGIELNDDIIDNELPPKYKKDLEAGKIDFSTFLTQAAEYLTKGKVIQGAGPGEKNQPNLGKVGGGRQPTTEAQSHDIVERYKKTIF